MSDPYIREREKMVAEQLTARQIRDPRVLTAMRKVPRHLFVSDDLQSRAYEDGPLPIGESQTISQPYIVALMAQSLELKGPERILEIGTGSGYEAAILAELCAEVYSIERLDKLAIEASALLARLGYRNIRADRADENGRYPRPPDGRGRLSDARAHSQGKRSPSRGISGGLPIREAQRSPWLDGITFPMETTNTASGQRSQQEPTL